MDTFRVLMVEDNPADAALIKSDLQNIKTAKFDVEHATTVADGLLRLGAGCFDVILLDLNLPDSEAQETLPRITEAAPDIAVVILTVDDNEALAMEAVNRGVQDYFVKGTVDERLLGRAIRYAIHRKRAETALLQAKWELEKRVYERTAELNAANHVLREAQGALRTSNIALEGRVRQLWYLALELTRAEERERRRIAQILHDHLQQILVGAKFAAETLSRHISDETLHSDMGKITDLLDQSISISRSLTAELVPPMLYEKGLPDALRWLVRWMQEKHGLEVVLQADERPQEVAQELRVVLFQSIRELLFNVAKHAKVKRAKVILRYGEDDILAARVQDEGVGFDPQALELASGRADTGFGLLAIRERLSALGGRLEIDSAPGRGTTTTIHLLIRFEQTIQAMGQMIESKSIAAPPKAEAGRHRIMVVDDHPIVRQGLIQALREDPAMDIIGEAEDGQQAVERAKSLQPDVVMMDVNMPRMNGIEATRIIHRDLPKVRVVGLSMYDSLDAGQTMREAGAVAYLSKSSPVEDLLAAIKLDS